MRISHFSYKSAAGVFVGSILASVVNAEVTSLSSSELTETYIQDSTIIVTPKQQASTDTRQTSYSSLTIVPIESTEQDLDAMEHSDSHLNGSETAFALSDELLRNTNVESTLNPLEPVAIQSYRESITQPVADILDDERYRPPTGNFDIDYQGKDLGLSRNGQQLTFSIGLPDGVDPVNLPYAINEGPLQITPRLGGGFDLTINIPQDN